MKKTSKRTKTTAAGVQRQTPSTDGLQERIRRRAYELWQQGGGEHGRDVAHWVQAEREVTGDRPQDFSTDQNQ